MAAVLVPATALGFSLQEDKQYSATAQLLFRDPGFDQKLFGASVLSPSQDPRREAATNATLVALQTISERAATVLRRPVTTVRDKVTVTPQGDADVVAVTATDTSPAFAAKLANTVAEEYIRFRRSADRSKINEAVELMRRQLNALAPGRRNGAEGRSIAARVEQLQVLASLQTGNAELVQTAATPRVPSSPKPVRNTVLGLILGLALGVALAVLFDRIDRRLRNASDAERLFDRPVLGLIPESRSLRKTDPRLIRLSGPEGEAFRALRTNLRYFAVDRAVSSVLITSSAPGDGKSTTARHLAAAAASSNVRVVLLEADLRRPILTTLFSDLHAYGLTDVLASQVPVSDVIQQIPVTTRVGDQATAMLDVLTAGSPAPNPSDLLESDRMGEVLSELEERYELVIVDTSPVSVVVDAIPLLGRVSGVVIVVRHGKSVKTAARMLRRMLADLRIDPLGIIVNSAPIKTPSAYYGYGLGSTAASNTDLATADRSNGGRSQRDNPEDVLTGQGPTDSGLTE